MSQAEPKEGWIDCNECEGEGIKALAGTRDHETCETCDGKGKVKCEHDQIGDHRECLDCGYDTTPDLMDWAEREVDRQTDLGIDRAKEEKAFPMEATD